MPGPFRFGEFELNVAAYVLLRAGERVKLERIPMEVLILMVGRSGSLVGRSEIETALWGSQVFVERDSAINTAVRKIRQALGDDAEQPRFVETVVGKGYRLIAPVEDLSAESRPLFPTFCLMRGKRQFMLAAGENLLGRDTTARVCIDHASVSRRHARITLQSDRAILEDLESRNGTFLNGRRIDTPVEIGHGAIIGLGPITLTVVGQVPAASTLAMTRNRGDGRAIRKRRLLGHRA